MASVVPPEQTSTQAPAQPWKFDGFGNSPFAEFLSSKLTELPEQERGKVTSSKDTSTDWASKTIDSTIQKFIAYEAAEKEQNKKIVAEQMAFVEELTPQAKDLFGDHHEELIGHLKEKASAPSKDFKLFHTLASQLVTMRSNAGEKRSADKFVKAASADGPEVQSAKRFGLPVPSAPSNSQASKQRELLNAMLGRK